MSTARQLTCAIAASVAILAMLATVAVGARLAWSTQPVATPGAPALHAGAVTVSTAHGATVVHDPWCERAEDMCRINYRPGGAWVIREVTP